MALLKICDRCRRPETPRRKCTDVTVAGETRHYCPKCLKRILGKKR